MQIIIISMVKGMFILIKLLNEYLSGLSIRVLIGEEIGVINVVEVVIVIIMVKGQGEMFIDFVVVKVIGVISIVVVVFEINSLIVVYIMNRQLSIR